jgi:hypothetical protein
LVGSKGVAAELKLSAKQRKTIAAVRQKVRQRHKKALAQVSPDKRPTDLADALDFEHKAARVRQAFFADEARALNRALPAILRRGQLARLGQIDLQRQGLRAFFDPRVVKALDLRGKQTKRIVGHVRDAFAQIHRGLPPAGRAGKEAARLGKLTAAALDKVLAELSAEQRRAWKDLTGKPFDFKPEPPRGKPRRP